MADNKINVGGRLHSIATGNVLAGANEILDDDKNKKQSDINTETYSLVNDVNERLSGLSPDQQSALNVAAKATNNEIKLGYYVCGTDDNVAAKVISDATGYILSKGGSIKVKMTNANTANNATLNINSTGAKPLYYDGERASANNTWEAGETVEVYYDGTNFYANNVAGSGGDGVFDVSEKYPTSGVEGGNTYTLVGALTVLDANLSASKKKGGISIKFVQSSDNNYVRYNLIANEFTTDVTKWAIDDAGVYFEDPEYLDVITDNNGQLLWAIRKDGKIHYGAGVPQQVIDYVEDKISSLSLDEYEDIVSFLSDYLGGDTTLKVMIEEINTQVAAKVDKVEGKSLIEAEFAGGVSQVENPEFIEVRLDAENKILWAIKADGTIYYGAGVPPQVIEYIQQKIEELGLTSVNDIVAFIGNLTEGDDLTTLLAGKVNTENGKGLIPNQYIQEIQDEEYIKKVLDFNKRFLEGFSIDGRKVIGMPLDILGHVIQDKDKEGWLCYFNDKNDNFLFGIRENGDFEYLSGIPQPIRDYIANNYKRKNELNEQQVENIMAAAQFANSYYAKLFQICLVSDSHGNESSVERAINITNKIPSIDAIIHLGDIVPWTPNDTRNGNPNALDDTIGLFDNCHKNSYFVCGNHDVGMSKYIYYTYTHEQIYNKMILPMIESGSLVEGEYNNTASDYAERCYYYHDFVASKVRLIALYEYGYPLELQDNEYWEPVAYDSSKGFIQPGVTYTYDENNPIILNCGGWKENSFRLIQTVTPTANPNGDQYGGTWPWYKLRGFSAIPKKQLEWLIATMNSTPDNYGIVIASHQTIMYRNEITDYKFSIGSNPNNLYNPRANGPTIDMYMDNNIVAKIVNAWINKTSIDERVAIRNIQTMQQDGNYLNTLTDSDGDYWYRIQADFSERTNNNAYFSCYINGHEHCDIIEQNKDFIDQLAIVTTCSSVSHRYMSDVVNSTTPDILKDSLTIFAANKDKIALSKYGATKTIAGIDRDYEVIYYNNI